MASTTTIRYLGGLKCQATHDASGAKVTTAMASPSQPAESFSPGDLLAAALGSCMMTVIAIAGKQKYGLDLEGMTVHVAEEVEKSPAWRIARLRVTVDVPVEVTDPQRQGLERAAMTCPVHKSIHPDTEVKVVFNWDAAVEA